LPDNLSREVCLLFDRLESETETKWPAQIQPDTNGMHGSFNGFMSHLDYLTEET